MKPKFVTLKSGSERRNIYYFICSICGHRRETVFKDIADRKICRECRSFKASENQQPLFDPPEYHDVNLEGKGMPIEK